MTNLDLATVQQDGMARYIEQREKDLFAEKESHKDLSGHVIYTAIESAVNAYTAEIREIFALIEIAEVHTISGLVKMLQNDMASAASMLKIYEGKLDGAPWCMTSNEFVFCECEHRLRILSHVRDLCGLPSQKGGGRK